MYEQFGIGKATLIGHSFGGIVATLFAEQYPDKIESLVLAGAPVTLQESFENIIARCKTIYQTKNDSINLRYLSMLEKMDKSSLQYSSFCFMHAMQNGFYVPKNRTEDAQALYAKLKADTLFSRHVAQMTRQAPQGFWKNEHYTTLDLSEKLKSLKHRQVPVYGIYGKEDGLYSEDQIKTLQTMIGATNLRYLDSCSHNVFIDQQNAFINAMITWAKEN